MIVRVAPSGPRALTSAQDSFVGDGAATRVVPAPAFAPGPAVFLFLFTAPDTIAVVTTSMAAAGVVPGLTLDVTGGFVISPPLSGIFNALGAIVFWFTLY
jgi:hypothetical protein